MKIKRMDEKAASEIIGTVLLLGMAIAFFSVLSITVLSYPSSSSSPSTNLVGMIIPNETNDEEYLLMEHRGGDALRLDTKVVITFNNGTSESITIGDEDKNYLTEKSKEDNLWGIGEWFFYNQDLNLDGQQVSIAVVDVESNSVIMTGSLRGT